MFWTSDRESYSLNTKKTTFRPFVLSKTPPTISKSNYCDWYQQGTNISHDESNYSDWFLLWTQGVYKNSLMTVISVKASYEWRKQIGPTKKSVQRVTSKTGICFERAIVNHTPSVPKKRLLGLLFCPKPSQLLANQTTVIGTNEVQIFRMTNQTTLIGFFWWTKGVGSWPPNLSRFWAVNKLTRLLKKRNILWRLCNSRQWPPTNKIGFVF